MELTNKQASKKLRNSQYRKRVGWLQESLNWIRSGTGMKLLRNDSRFGTIAEANAR